MRDEDLRRFVEAVMPDLTGCAPVSCISYLLDSGCEEQDLPASTFKTAHSGYGLSGDKGAAAASAAKLPGKIRIPLARPLAAPVGLVSSDTRYGRPRRLVCAAIRNARPKSGRQDMDCLSACVGDRLGAVIGCQWLDHETAVSVIEAVAGRSFRVAPLLTAGAPIGFFREFTLVPAPAGLKAPGQLARSGLNI